MPAATSGMEHSTEPVQVAEISPTVAGDRDMNPMFAGPAYSYQALLTSVT
jgi:hypothetical protein